MTINEIAEKHLPINTTCIHKKKQIYYKREQLVKDIEQLLNDHTGDSKAELREGTPGLRTED